MPNNSRKNISPLELLLTDPEVRDALSDLGVFVRNIKNGETVPNYLWYDLGYKPEEMTVDFWEQIIHPDDRDRALRNYELVLKGDISTYRITYRVKSKAGKWHAIVNSGRVVSWNKNGDPEVFIGSDVDITQRQLTQEALARAKEEAEQQAQEAEALRTASAIVASTLEIGKTVQLVLEQAQNVVAYDTATVQLLKDDALEVIGGNGWDDLDAITGLRIPLKGESPHSAAMKSGKTLVVNDVRDDYPQFSSIAGNVIRSWLGVPLAARGETIGLIAMDSVRPGTFTPTDVRLATALGDHVAVALQNARLYEKTKEMAMTDSLTGASTRRSFFVQAEAALLRAIERNNELSVLMADLDHFKQINDVLGHAAGDAAIKMVADAAHTVLRKTDVMGRYGGEEFAVILPQTGAAAAERIAERLRAVVSEIRLPGSEHKLTVSVGIRTCKPTREDTVDSILNQADQALLDAKRSGRDRVTVYQTV